MDTPLVEKTYPTCPRDGFPLVKIGGHEECVAEYLDRCIGQRRIVDVVQRKETVYYVFENGHELPMLCFCCGHPLEFRDLAKTRREMQGRRLKSMSMCPVQLRDGKVILAFTLEFSGKLPFWSPLLGERVSPLVAAQMRHPENCPYRPGLPGKKRGRRRK